LILEGLPAIVCGILTYFVLPARPAEAKFLDAEEKDWLAAELAQEGRAKISLQLPAIDGLSHRRVWHLAFISFTFQIGGCAIYFWMPQAVR
jgi:MFS transporter, ACS family, tartrate transporter